MNPDARLLLTGFVLLLVAVAAVFALLLFYVRRVRKLEQARRALQAAAREAERLRAALEAQQEQAASQRRQEEERQHVERQALQLTKWESLGAMASGIAHDFNNLLVGVMGNAELVLDMVPPDAPIRPMLEDIRTSGTRAADLIGQMMAFAGQGRARIERVDLNRLVREMDPLIRAAIPKRIPVHFEPALTEAPIEADIAQVRQALMNVLLNAAEAIGDAPGEIAIRVRTLHADRAYLAGFLPNPDLAEGEYAAVEVADTGAGLDPATLQKLFDPFFTTKFDGRGLGLSAVLGILRGHYGAVKAAGAPGRGSTFTLLFPLCRPEAVAPPTPTNAPTPAAGTVLLVDDEEAITRVAQRMLEQAGYRVLAANDGRAATDLFWKHRDAIDAVVLDLAMPTLGGEEVFLVLRHIRADVPILVASGFTEDEARNRFGERNVDGFIKKPYSGAELLAALQQVIGSRAA